MRILMMLYNFPWSQSIDGIFNLLQARALRELGHEVRILRCSPWSPPLGQRWNRYRSIPSSYTYGGFAVRTLRVLMGPRHFGIGSISFQLRSAIAQELATFAPDVVQVHGLIPAGVMALDLPVPYILTGHGTETYRAAFVRTSIRRVAESIVSGAAACVGVSGFVADCLRRLGARSPTVIFNGADERVFFPRDRGAARVELNLDPNRPVVVYAGNFIAQKGMGELQAAALALRDLRPQFLFAGAGNMLRGLRNALHDAAIDVHCYGVVAHEKLATLFAATDVVVLPSYAEGLPASLCEAMCAGRAIVSTRVGGIPEIVNDGVSGYIVEPRDVFALNGRLRSVLTDGALRDRFERAGLAFAREHLTWRINAQAYDDLYRTVSGSRAAEALEVASQRRR